MTQRQVAFTMRVGSHLEQEEGMAGEVTEKEWIVFRFGGVVVPMLRLRYTCARLIAR